VRPRGTKPPPLYRCRCSAHRLGHGIVPTVEVVLPAVSVAHVRELVVREAHRRAAVPPWRPYLRASLAHATAAPLSEPAATTTGPNCPEATLAA
jgi:hypothetical protein